MSKPTPDPAPPATILIVDDLHENLEVLGTFLESAGHQVLAASNGADALRIAERARPDIVLLDVVMPGLDGLETCRQLKSAPGTREIPVVFITARDDVGAVVAGFDAGGVDYVAKPFQAEVVLRRVATHLRMSRMTRELRDHNQELEARTAELKAEVERRRKAEEAFRRADEQLDRMSSLEAERWKVEGLIGSSPHIVRLTEHIRRLHQFGAMNVLITGESGTGKELIARAIHFGSPRARAPFVPVNCVAIPSELAESILFGHVRGAFTGATTDRKGCFELADGGTLFLDEIGDMPAVLQVKLLRVLEDGMITPVGASQAKHIDVRIVAATNADLSSRMNAGTFRSDLFYRLARYTIATEPLRSRRGDIPILARHFLRRFAQEMNLPAPDLTADSLAALESHDYPGNIRELRNILERAVIDCCGGAIEPVHLNLPVPARATAPAVASDTEPAENRKSARVEFAANLPLNLAAAEDLLIQRALQETGGNIADAARLLGVHRTRIYRKLSQEPPASSA